MEIDINGESNFSMAGIKENRLLLRPVSAGESGEGLPYAPVNWPNPGDTWSWKVGRRTTSSGFYADRYLYPPDHLQKTVRGRHSFASKHSLEQYIKKEFPNADLDAFFGSFSWKIPAHSHAWATDGSVSCVQTEEEMTEHSGSESNCGTMYCKARNKTCSLQIQARSYPLEFMDCDICCAEHGFCRNCCCILCCKTIDWTHGGYTFIRCEARVSGNYICGHAAHIDCALRSYLAGTVGGSIGLDVEYYCRRCDSRMDLITHVSGLLRTCETLDSREDVEKTLNVCACILHGSQQTSAKKLLHRIKLAMTKLKSGMHLGDIWKVEENISAVTTGEMPHVGTNENMLGTLEGTNYQDSFDFTIGSEFSLQLDNVPRSQQPVYITSDHRIESVKLEDEIDQVLKDLKKSQEAEYRTAEERLYSQKNVILSLYQQLDVERSELARRTSSTGGRNFDEQLNNVLIRVNQIKSEVVKLRDMKEVAKGFGKAAKGVLKEHFGFDIGD